MFSFTKRPSFGHGHRLQEKRIFFLQISAEPFARSVTILFSFTKRPSLVSPVSFRNNHERRPQARGVPAVIAFVTEQDPLRVIGGRTLLASEVCLSLIVLLLFFFDDLVSML